MLSELAPTQGQPAFTFGSHTSAEYPADDERSALEKVADGGTKTPTGKAARNDDYQQLKILLEERKVITSADAQNLLGLDAILVRPLLKRLIEDRLAVTEGQRRGLRYVSTSKHR